MGRISASGSIDLNLDTCKRERASLKTLHRPGKWVDLNKILKDIDNNTNRLQGRIQGEGGRTRRPPPP